MSSTPALARDALRRQHRFLLAGLVVFWALIGALLYFGSGPMAPELSIPPSIVTAMCAGLSLFGLFWARPRIPPRSAAVSIDDYWKDGRASASMALLIFLLEGAATIGAVWTLLTGSWTTAAASFLSIALLALNGPERFESPDGLL